MDLRQPHYQAPLARIKEIAANSQTDWEFSGHALEEMARDGLDELDARNAILRATKAIEQIDDDGPKYVVTGKDTEGRQITICIQVEDTPPWIFVITVWKISTRR